MDESRQNEETATEQVTATSIEILRIQKGDTVIVRAEATDAQQVAFISQVFGSLFQNLGLAPGEVHLLIIPANLDIKVLDQSSMKKQGWERRGLIAVPGQNGIRH